MRVGNSVAVHIYFLLKLCATLCFHAIVVKPVKQIKCKNQYF
jgi:hypothetical protein